MDNIDSQLLRWIIGGIGALAIIVVYIWGRHRRSLINFLIQRNEFDELEIDETPPAKEKTQLQNSGHGSSTTDKVLSPATSLSKPGGSGGYPKAQDKANPIKTTHNEAMARDSARKASPVAPVLIQLSVVASDKNYFNGLKLRDSLEELRLIYGDMGIYHRYDRDYRISLFSVASLVEPGTFPIKDMENFECPGVVLFFQPQQAEDPLAVFDDLVATCHELALSLGGKEWDEEHQPLTMDKIAQIRDQLMEAY